MSPRQGKFISSPSHILLPSQRYAFLTLCQAVEHPRHLPWWPALQTIHMQLSFSSPTTTGHELDVYSNVTFICHIKALKDFCVSTVQTTPWMVLAI